MKLTFVWWAWPVSVWWAWPVSVLWVWLVRCLVPFVLFLCEMWGLKYWNPLSAQSGERQGTAGNWLRFGTEQSVGAPGW